MYFARGPITTCEQVFFYFFGDRVFARVVCKEFFGGRDAGNFSVSGFKEETCWSFFRKIITRLESLRTLINHPEELKNGNLNLLLVKLSVNLSWGSSVGSLSYWMVCWRSYSSPVFSLNRFLCQIMSRPNKV